MSTPVPATTTTAAAATAAGAAARPLAAEAAAGTEARVALRATADPAGGGSITWTVGGLALVLFLVIVAVLVRRRRLAEMAGRSTAEGLGAEGRDEGRNLSELLAGLRTPFILFLVLWLLNRVVPFLPGGFGPDDLTWLRLLVVVTGVYLGAEFLFLLVVDYLLVEVEGVEIPRIFYQMIKILVFVLIYLPILSTQFAIDITPLLTTSAVLTMVVGLALQDSLGNLFSGIAMQLSNPFKVGDWVHVAGQEGRVTEVNWRATTIKTFSNDYLIIPNSSISKAEIQNYSRPTKVHACLLPIGLSYKDSPEQVEKVLIEAASAIDGVLPRPRPQVRLRSFDDFTITYVIKYFILDYSKSPVIESAIRVRLWYALRRAGMEIPFPIRTIETKPAPDTSSEVMARVSLLTKVDFMQPVSENGLRELAASFRVELFPSGYDIVHRGDEGDTFYVIRRGRAEVLVAGEEGADVRVAELGPSAFFGEMSLLTGERRNATVRTLEEVEALALGKDAFRNIIQKEPKLAERVSEVLVSRRKATQDELTRRAGKGRAAPRSSAEAGEASVDRREQQNLLKKIILFFGM